MGLLATENSHCVRVKSSNALGLECIETTGCTVYREIGLLEEMEELQKVLVP